MRRTHGEIDRLEDWVRGLTWQQVMNLVDVRLSGGLMQGQGLLEFFRSRYQDPGIEALAKKFACVGTELTSGREVWLQQGPVLHAVRASIALPGLPLSSLDCWLS